MLAAGVCLAIGLVIFASSLLLTYKSQIPGPVRDFWTFIPMLEALDRGESLMPLLFKFHANAHRLVVPKLLYLVEYSFFQGRNSFLMSLSVIIHLISVFILLRVIQNRINGLKRNEIIFAFGLILALSFSAIQYPSLIRPWNIAWQLCTSGMIAAFASLLRIQSSDQQGRPGEAWSWWVGAILAGLTANYSLGSGLLIWPSLLLVGFLMRLRWRFLAGFAIAGFVAIRVFNLFRDPTTKLIERPGDIAQWMLKCLSVPISWDHQAAGMLFAALGISTAGALALRLLRRRSPPLPAECLLLGVMVVSLGGIVMASISRMDMGWHRPRYQTLTLPFWMSLGLLGLLTLRGLKTNRQLASTGAMLLTTLWLSGVVLPAHFQSIKDATSAVKQDRLAKIAILMGAEHRILYERVLPIRNLRRGKDLAVSSRAFMTGHRLGVFADGHHELLARSMNDSGLSTRADSCHGKVRSPIKELKQTPGIGRVRGSVSARPGSRLQDVLLVAASPDGAIIGMAGILDRRFDPLGWSDGSVNQFTGYVRLVSKSVDVFAIDENGIPCAVARGVPIQ